MDKALFSDQHSNAVIRHRSMLLLPCRRAYELAFASTYMFAGQRPTFKEVDEVTFMRPVDVGDLLRLRSCILHTQLSPPGSNKVHIMPHTYLLLPVVPVH